MKVNFPNTGDAQFFIFYLLPFFFQRLFLLPEHPYGIYLPLVARDTGKGGVVFIQSSGKSDTGMPAAKD